MSDFESEFCGYDSSLTLYDYTQDFEHKSKKQHKCNECDVIINIDEEHLLITYNENDYDEYYDEDCPNEHYMSLPQHIQDGGSDKVHRMCNECGEIYEALREMKHEPQLGVIRGCYEDLLLHKKRLKFEKDVLNPCNKVYELLKDTELEENAEYLVDYVQMLLDELD